MITGQSLAVDGGMLTGYGEDLRPVIRKRMAEAEVHMADATPSGPWEDALEQLREWDPAWAAAW